MLGWDSGEGWVLGWTGRFRRRGQRVGKREGGFIFCMLYDHISLSIQQHFETFNKDVKMNE